MFIQRVSMVLWWLMKDPMAFSHKPITKNRIYYQNPYSIGWDVYWSPYPVSMSSINSLTVWCLNRCACTCVWLSVCGGRINTYQSHKCLFCVQHGFWHTFKSIGIYSHTLTRTQLQLITWNLEAKWAGKQTDDGREYICE